MATGFCHGVLNTDNMSITGESFDYGPYAFISTFDPYFTAAYFDYYRRYAYGQQPKICHLNLELLQEPLKMIIPENDLQAGLARFGEFYQAEYHSLMLKKLGFINGQFPESAELLDLTISLLQVSQISYHKFFAEMARSFSTKWRDELAFVVNSGDIFPSLAKLDVFEHWCLLYHQILNNLNLEDMDQVAKTLVTYNPQTALLRPVIESTWEKIATEDNWQPFYQLVADLTA
jgi:uncharacterized protein YdiU (UPF0061 family)